MTESPLSIAKGHFSRELQNRDDRQYGGRTDDVPTVEPTYGTCARRRECSGRESCTRHVDVRGKKMKRPGPLALATHTHRSQHLTHATHSLTPAVARFSPSPRPVELRTRISRSRLDPFGRRAALCRPRHSSRFSHSLASLGNRPTSILRPLTPDVPHQLGRRRQSSYRAKWHTQRTAAYDANAQSEGTVHAGTQQ